MKNQTIDDGKTILTTPSNPFITLANGKPFYFLNPKPSDFNIENIAHSLSMLCRFVAQSDRFYTISQHCCLVSDILPDELKLEGLLHDSVESTMGDLPSALKKIMPTYKEIEFAAETAMASRFKLVFPFPPEIKLADTQLLATEMRDFLPGSTWETIPTTPLKERIEPWSIERSKTEFLSRFFKLERK